MMSLIPTTLENLARIGANIDLSNHTLQPLTLENLVRIASNNGGHITINASEFLPSTLENLAHIGRNSITFKF